MLATEIHGNVRVLRLAHGKANALDLELLWALIDALRAAEAAPERALVLAGAGKIFCAGVDLTRLLAEGTSYLERFLPALDAVCLRLYAFPKPSVAALAGPAIAGGCVLACACDRRIAAESARIGVPELRVGLSFPLPALEITRAALHPGRAADVLYQGRILQGEAAREAGLCDELVPAAEVDARALAAAAELASLEPAGFALNKRMLRGPLLERLRRENEAAAPQVLAQWSSAAARAALAAYVATTLGGARPPTARS